MGSMDVDHTPADRYLQVQRSHKIRNISADPGLLKINISEDASRLYILTDRPAPSFQTFQRSAYII